MKHFRIFFSLVICICFILLHSFSQQLFPSKKLIDLSIQWPTLSDAAISNDGKYFVYSLSGIIADSLGGHDGTSSQRHIYFQSSQLGSKPILLDGAESAKFSEDCRYLLFHKSGGGLVIRDLISHKEKTLNDVASFSLEHLQSSEWLIYRKNAEQLDMVMVNLSTGKQLSFKNVNNYKISPNRQYFVYQSQRNKQNELCYVQLKNPSPLVITRTTDEITDITFSNDGKQLAFFIAEKIKDIEVLKYPSAYPYWNKYAMPRDVLQPEIVTQTKYSRTLMLYKDGASQAERLVDNQSAGIDDELDVAGGQLSFDESGKRIFFQLEKTITAPISVPEKEDQVMVEVWHYKDFNLPTQQQLAENRFNIPVYVNADQFAGQSKVFSLIKEDEDQATFSTEYKANYYVVRAKAKWPYDNKNRSYIVSLKDGSRKMLPEEYRSGSFSPDGRYILYFDNNNGHYFIYESATGVTRNITENLPSPFYTDDNDGSSLKYNPALFKTTWFKDGSGVIISDRHDVWRFDPGGSAPPYCITKGYGRRHGVVLRMLEFNSSQDLDLKEGDEIILKGLKWSTKDNGYFKVVYGAKNDPELLTMGPFIYSGFDGDLHPSTMLPCAVDGPIKAKNADVYLINRMSADKAPNLFITKNFKEFIPITNIQPQKEYNWLTTELITWKMPDGNSSQGILYKPENFDASNKYPVIMWFYEKNSPALNAFQIPSPSYGDLNIPYFVSRGYLVFVPDIYYKSGGIAESAYNAIYSAGQMLTQLSYVNAKKIGIQGHSFGGFEVNYVITRTNMFAAAMSAMGPCDHISQYGDLEAQTGADLHDFAENGQLRMGGKTLWEDRDTYINNSPIFFADKIETPVLLLFAKKDGVIGWDQATEWFGALRRLNKKAWMLQYDNEPHSLLTKKNQIDFTIRMQQFFDYYLKDIAAPKWLTRGINPHLKGIETGLDPDEEIRTP